MGPELCLAVMLVLDLDTPEPALAAPQPVMQLAWRRWRRSRLPRTPGEWILFGVLFGAFFIIRLAAGGARRSSGYTYRTRPTRFRGYGTYRRW